MGDSIVAHTAGRSPRASAHSSAGFAALAVIAAIALVGCGSSPTYVAPPGSAGATVPAATAAVTETPSATAVPQATGSATLQLTVTVDPNVTGAWPAGSGVNCNNPTLAGLNILAFATAPDGRSIVVLTITEGRVNVSERAGSSASSIAREFTGTGVTGFDPARGATIDSDVEIVPTPAINGGTLGTITHVTGAVDCGGQTTGTSTVVASGTSPEGTVEGPFSTFRVICNESTASGLSANLIGVIATANPPAYLIVGLPANGNATMFTITDGPTTQHTYAIDEAGTSSYTVTATGIHLDADFIEVVEATGTPHVIHLEGDGTCGTFNTSA